MNEKKCGAVIVFRERSGDMARQIDYSLVVSGPSPKEAEPVAADLPTQPED